MLKRFKITTSKIQKERVILHDFRVIVYAPIDGIENEKREISSSSYDSKFKSIKAPVLGTLSRSPCLKSGVYEIQSNTIVVITEKEQNTCERLILTENVIGAEEMMSRNKDSL